MTRRRPRAARASRMRSSSSLSLSRVTRSGRIVCNIEPAIVAQPKVSDSVLRYLQKNGNHMRAVLDYKRKVYSIRDLPTLPVIAQKVLRLADDDEASAEKLTAMISNDQALSVKVLGLANS